MDQRRGPKPACPDKVRHLDEMWHGMRSNRSHGTSTCVTDDDAIFRMHCDCHFCDSNICPPCVTFFYYCSTEEVLCNLTMLEEEE